MQSVVPSNYDLDNISQNVDTLSTGIKYICPRPVIISPLSDYDLVFVCCGPYETSYLARNTLHIPFPSLIPRRFPAESLPFWLLPPPKFVAHLTKVREKLNVFFWANMKRRCCCRAHLATASRHLRLSFLLAVPMLEDQLAWFDSPLVKVNFPATTTVRHPLAPSWDSIAITKPKCLPLLFPQRALPQKLVITMIYLLDYAHFHAASS